LYFIGFWVIKQVYSYIIQSQVEQLSVNCYEIIARGKNTARNMQCILGSDISSSQRFGIFDYIFIFCTK